MTKEQEQATIAALLEEKRGYEVRVLQAEEDGNEEALKRAKSQVAGVDAELRKLGGKAQPKAKRASTR